MAGNKKGKKAERKAQQFVRVFRDPSCSLLNKSEC